MKTESYPHPTVESVLADIQWIENTIEELKDTLRLGKCINASIALPPLHAVDETGWDSVYDPIEAIELDRIYGKEALEYALQQFGFMERNHDSFKHKDARISQVAARRSVGVVHIVPLDELSESSIRELVKNINHAKLKVKSDLKLLYPNTMERGRKFYTKYFPNLLPKSITRLIQVAPPTTTRVTFSWLNKGYSTEKMDREKTITYIDRINRQKLSSNPDIQIDLNTLNQNDEARLSHYQTFYRMLPAKLNPRQQTTIRTEDGKLKQMPPQRAVVPILVIQPTPLDNYHELSDLSSLASLRLCKNKKLVDHVAAIEEYGLYAWDERRRTDNAS
ncbi:DNA replication terminus site-binding protein (plasmid) [Vibrio harveyi]|uniref:DNA replication terminus site-binding protein n=1 Tax=Vibrio harveyi TaxID=669 RepID=UPI00247FA518|nr:DNA replication terminus site-binding protein [Vibrio harveyi]